MAKLEEKYIKKGGTPHKVSRLEVPIWEKENLTLEEAAAYFNIGMGKLRELTEPCTCPFVLWVGHKRLIKRKKFEKFLDDTFSI